MELPLAVRFKQLKATSKETVGVYRLDQWCLIMCKSFRLMNSFTRSRLDVSCVKLAIRFLCSDQQQISGRYNGETVSFVHDQFFMTIYVLSAKS